MTAPPSPPSRAAPPTSGPAVARVSAAALLADVSGVIPAESGDEDRATIRRIDRPREPASVVEPPVAVDPAFRIEATAADRGDATMPEASPEVDPDKLPVPPNEFGSGATAVEHDKLRIAHGQATIKRDAAGALLGLPEQPLTVVAATPVEVLLRETAEMLRGDPTATDGATTRFERGDPTQSGLPDAAATHTPPAGLHTAAGRLRTVASLRRQRGLLGDVLYVRTALFGVRRSRAELTRLEVTQAARQDERRKHLVILGRTAAGSDAFDHPALGPARDQLGGIEDDRGRHRAQVMAADAELTKVTKARAAAATQHVTDVASVDAELAELARRLEPLAKEQTQISRRAADLRDQLRRIDATISETTASLVSVKQQKVDPVTIQAELATLKAERLAIQKDEPKLAAELDALNPRIASVEAKRAESTRRRAELLTSEQADQRRAEELLAAIGAKRKVMDRAAGDAETVRDRILFELGERLYMDRPGDLGAQLAAVDAIDVELATADRRLMELREILSTVDRWKLARGLVVLAVVVGGLSTAGIWAYVTLG